MGKSFLKNQVQENDETALVKRRRCDFLKLKTITNYSFLVQVSELFVSKLKIEVKAEIELEVC